ncbi:MAG TPA: hypothetical protein VJ851_04615 [Jatrophihabitans sp.]|nr:hypothetical protein [Jatrophihabitans sp.]
MQQHPGRGFVDVLRARHQHGAGLLDGQVDLDIISPIAGQPIDLVHDDVADRVLGQEPKHSLEVGSGGGSSRLARVGELSNDGNAELFSLATASLSLGR